MVGEVWFNALGCGPSIHGFKSRTSPQFLRRNMKKIIFLILTVFILSSGLCFSKPYHKNHDYRQYPGYRSKPYVERNYHHYHSYDYRGHWRSWNEWESYYHRHPHFHRYGRYERMNNQLFFMFNDGFNMFMFSIGR